MQLLLLAYPSLHSVGLGTLWQKAVAPQSSPGVAQVAKAFTEASTFKSPTFMQTCLWRSNVGYVQRKPCTQSTPHLRYVYVRSFLFCIVIWNFSKRADNASGLVQPELLKMIFRLLCQDDEEGDVLRRIVSCVHNLASMRRFAPRLLPVLLMKIFFNFQCSISTDLMR